MSKLKTLLAVVVAGMAIVNAEKVGASDVQTVGNSNIQTVGSSESSSGIFSPNETSLDLFGYTASRDKGGSSTEAWGSGVGVNHFFTEYLGLGGDSYMDAFTLPYLLNANGIFRFPIPQTGFAVYGFGGGGRQWSHAPQWLGDIGGGGEYRFSTHTGFFLDIREVLPVNTGDYTMFRFGFRIKVQ